MSVLVCLFLCYNSCVLRSKPNRSMGRIWCSTLLSACSWGSEVIVLLEVKLQRHLQGKLGLSSKLACRCRAGMRLLFALFSQICFALLGGKLIIKTWENIARAKSPIRLEVCKPAVAMGLKEDHRLKAYMHNSEPEQLLNQLFLWQTTCHSKLEVTRKKEIRAQTLETIG